ncbi:OmpP1/FadL family transporter [Thermosulfurimonas sp. F29]|uniref:OmpP1/FadL family transporter n=1 Tax=Thermosulfurimonas sp. F29 TaxID=2867247 RepID=UPI001C83E835|nr:OmpP1/FadL family transporter [Thermosulfurimonas sp. F29]MBX6423234.1 OmpP1/FadL family transporter [Thermosulfurimonas sp. F29]
MHRMFLLLLLWILGTNGVFAAGFQLFNEGSARVMGLSAAVTARTDMVEAAWYNPSATAFLKAPEVMAGLSLVYPTVKFENDRGPNFDMVEKVHPLPFLYAAYPLNERLTLNLSLNVPYGLATDWDGDWAGRYDAVYTSLFCYFITPSVAVKLTKRLSLAVGAQIVYADAELRKSVAPTTTGVDVKTKLTGDDWDGGFLVALTYRLREHTTLGLVYRSQVTLDLEGDAKYYNNAPGTVAVLPAPGGGFTFVSASQAFRNGDGEVFLDLPDTLSFGITTRYFRRWILSLDLMWTGWSTYEQLKYKFEHEPGNPTGAPGTVVQPKDWDDVWAVRFGAEYLLNDRWSLRFGYAFDPSPIDDRYRGPELPTNDRHFFNLGVGYRRGNLTMDAAYTYVHMEDAKPGTAPEANRSNLDGTYTGHAHIVGFDLSYRF